MAMRYIGTGDQEKIRARFENELVHEVRLVLFVQPPTGLFIPGREEPQTGRQAQALMEELAELSDKLTLEVHNPRLEPELAQQYGVERSPALVMERADWTGGRVRFFGLPSGYEFTTLLEDIVDVSRGATRLSEKTREALSAVTTPVHLQVFVTPT
jgi:alkyl hydroperoxide reductase subunit AhpF